MFLKYNFNDIVNIINNYYISPINLSIHFWETYKFATEYSEKFLINNECDIPHRIMSFKMRIDDDYCCNYFNVLNNKKMSEKELCEFIENELVI